MMAGSSFPARLLACAPSILSSSRLVLALAFFFLPCEWRRVAVFGAAVTDLVDGHLARRFGVTSWQGGLLDAISDKLFVLIVVMVITIDGLLQPWQVLILLLRDFTVALLAVYIALIGEWHAFKKMPSRFSGKAMTAAMFVIFLTVLSFPRDHELTDWIFLLAALLSIVASADYIILFGRRLRERSPQQPG